MRNTQPGPPAECMPGAIKVPSCVLGMARKREDLNGDGVAPSRTCRESPGPCPRKTGVVELVEGAITCMPILPAKRPASPDHSDTSRKAGACRRPGQAAQLGGGRCAGTWGLRSRQLGHPARSTPLGPGPLHAGPEPGTPLRAVSRVSGGLRQSRTPVGQQQRQAAMPPPLQKVFRRRRAALACARTASTRPRAQRSRP
jgi:hypothetical protein